MHGTERAGHSAHGPSRVLRPYPGTVRFDAHVGDIRIGVVVPFDFGVDWQYWGYVPKDVSLHFTRTPYTPLGVGVALAEAVSRPDIVDRAVRTLGAIEPTAVAYACSSGSFVDGLSGERRLRQTMLEAGAPRVVTTSGAMLDALHAGGARRVALATPYSRELTDRLAAFLEDGGVEVVSAVYLDLDERIDDVGQETICDLVRRAHSPQADALFVSCTGLRTLGVVAALEAEIGRPVFTANQVTLWGALTAAGALRTAEGEPVLGDGDPMAWSTAMLVGARHIPPTADDPWAAAG